MGMKLIMEESFPTSVSAGAKVPMVPVEESPPLTWQTGARSAGGGSETC